MLAAVLSCRDVTSLGPESEEWLASSIWLAPVVAGNELESDVNDELPSAADPEVTSPEEEVPETESASPHPATSARHQSQPPNTGRRWPGSPDASRPSWMARDDAGSATRLQSINSGSPMHGHRNSIEGTLDDVLFPEAAGSFRCPRAPNWKKPRPRQVARRRMFASLKSARCNSPLDLPRAITNAR